MYLSELLGDEHELQPFTSGRQSLDDWLKQHARQAQAKRLGRTYVWCKNGGVVVAYFTLSPHLLEREAVPRKIGRGDPDRIPAILLGRLALDITLSGQGLGSQLLVDALHRAAGASEAVGGRYVVVDAIDEVATSFYEKHGFRRLPDTAPQRLLRKVSDIAADLGLR